MSEKVGIIGVGKRHLKLSVEELSNVRIEKPLPPIATDFFEYNNGQLNLRKNDDSWYRKTFQRPKVKTKRKKK